jgi:hypothetical protein
VRSNHTHMVRVSVKSGVGCRCVIGVRVPKIFTCGAGARELRGGATCALPSRVPRASLQGQSRLLWDAWQMRSGVMARVLSVEE